MTPTEQDKKIIRGIEKALEKSFSYQVLVLNKECRDELMQLITADRERVALEARQDELTKAFTAVVGDKNTPSSRYSKVTRLFNKYLQERYKQLKAQQEANQ